MTPPPQPTKNSVETLKASRFSLDHEFRAARSSLADRLHVFREHGSERPLIAKSNAPSQPRNWGYAARDVSIVSYVVFRIYPRANLWLKSYKDRRHAVHAADLPPLPVLTDGKTVHNTPMHLAPAVRKHC